MPTSRTPAHDFFETHVVPNHEAWLAQPTDIRLAMNGVLSLYHMADHFWHAYATTDPSRIFSTANSGLFRAELANRNDRFAVLRDVAEAHKHMKLDRQTRVLTVRVIDESGEDYLFPANYFTAIELSTPARKAVLAAV